MKHTRHLALLLAAVFLQACDLSGAHAQTAKPAEPCTASATFALPAVGAGFVYEVKKNGAVVSILKREVIAVKNGFVTTRDTYTIPGAPAGVALERVVTEWLGLFSVGYEANGQKFETQIAGLDQAKLTTARPNATISASGSFTSSFPGDSASGSYKVTVTALGCVPGSGARRYQVVEQKGKAKTVFVRELDVGRGVVLVSRTEGTGASMVLKE
jgi:hypothetical protein